MEGFRLKTQEELKQQVTDASDSLKEDIVPPSKKDDIYDLSVQEIKERFPVRYEAYLKLLKSKIGNVVISETERKEMADFIHALNNLDVYIENHKSNEGDRTLREKQFTVFEAIRDFLEEGNKEGYIKLPTGSGKTVIFSELVDALGLKTLIVVPTQILLEQTEKELDHFTEDFDIGKFYAHAKELDKDNLLTTYQSLVLGVRDGSIDPSKYQCLILDEAHKALGEGRTDIIKQFNGAIKIGFTATPTYSEDRNVKNLLDTEIYSIPIKEAVEGGLICGFSVILVQTNVNLSEVKVTTTGEYNQDDLEKAVNIEARNKAGVEIYKKMFDGERAVVYCSGVEHAKKISELFNEQGVSAAYISGYQNKDERQKIIDDFKEGKIKVICNADILIEGFNEKRASVCINLRPTLSRVVTEQRGGRVLRLNEDNPDKIGKIVDFVDVYDQNRGSLSFADIVGEASVSREPTEKTVGEQDTKETKESAIKPNIGLDFTITTESKEVMRILNGLNYVEKEKKEFLPFDQLQKEVRLFNIKSSIHYNKEYKNHNGWPNGPAKMYKDQWFGWEDFLGKEKKDLLTFEQLQKEVRETGIKSHNYFKEYKNHQGWPSNPPKIYKDQWTSWEEFLGREKKEFLPFDQLQKEVRGANIKKVEIYFKEYKNHHGWPSNPPITYKDQWTGWEDFLGKEKKDFLTFDQLQKEVREANIKKAENYFKEYKNHHGWPSNPTKIYNDQWVSWEEFLGTEKISLLFDQLQKEVREANIKSRESYIKEYKNHDGWPSKPSITYKDQWTGWEDFLDKEKKEFLPFDQLQKEVRGANIKKVEIYFKEYKNHHGWPSNPPITYKDQWTGWVEFLGKNNH